MKIALLTAAVLATAVAAAPAQALNYFSIPGAVDPGLAPGEHTLLTFDAPTAIGSINDPVPTTVLPGVTLTTSGPVGVFQGLTSGVAAPPAGDSSQYLAVGTGGSATFDFTGYFTGKHITSISVYVGSLDTYNTLKVLKTDGSVLATLTGADFANMAANGNQFIADTNRRLYLTFTAGEDVGGLTFASSQPAFELDTVAVSALTFATVPSGPTPTLPPVTGGSIGLVPEPASWALMLAGFALTGIAVRRRRVVVAA